MGKCVDAGFELWVESLLHGRLFRVAVGMLPDVVSRSKCLALTKSRNEIQKAEL